METEFREGDIIVINPYLKPEHNDYVVIANDEGGATFKQLKKYGKTRVLHPLNPKYDNRCVIRRQKIINSFSVSLKPTPRSLTPRRLKEASL